MEKIAVLTHWVADNIRMQVSLWEKERAIRYMILNELYGSLRRV